MSRLQRAAAILEAADTWKQRCLLDGGSLFSDEKLWIRECFGQLHTYFVERLDKGSGSFEEKLRTQLEPASPEAKRLWAEMTWLYYLMVTSVKPLTKLDRIRRVWQWSGAPLPETHWALGDVLGRGIVNFGVGYLSHQYLEFRFIVTLMLEWCAHSIQERHTLLREPWSFAEWLDAQKDARRRPFRHALLFLLFPDVFEPIVSLNHKKAVVEAFPDEAGEKPDVGNITLLDLDKALQAVVKRLQDQYPGQEIQLYHSPLKERWLRGSPTPVDSDGSKNRDDEEWYRDRFGTADVWAIGAGQGARFWPDFQEQGIAAIGYSELDDLGEYESKEAIQRVLIENGRGPNPSNHSLAAWEFAHEIKIGDVLIAKRGRSVILGWGEVTGEYRHDPDRVEYPNLRPVSWHPCRTPISLPDLITTKTLTRFTPYKQWLRDIFRLMDDDAPTNGTGGGGERPRRPNLNFLDMGIQIGSRLVSVKTGEKAIVVAQNRVTFLGEEMSLTAATRRTVGRRTPPCPQWTFEGRNLSDVYAKTYGKGPDPWLDPEPYTIATALTDLFVEEAQLHRILDSLALRKNLILQGPPGVGKTFIAKRIAWCRIGYEDPGSIEMVQFHQSYAYEDFVQGWRPTETGGFTLRNGVFFEFCKRAEQEPETRFVFIIDEINRGNLSRIFGELLMLIEADKRGPDHAISLTYSTVGERFSVPDNVHILGLMNTADRSLAIVDYALRRRFAFETLEPAYGTRQFRDYLLNADVDLSLVDRIDRNLSALNERIRDDKDLGPGFRIGHSYFVPNDSADEEWYMGIIDTQIVPLLREYWFDRPEQVDRMVEELRR